VIKHRTSKGRRAFVATRRITVLPRLRRNVVRWLTGRIRVFPVVTDLATHRRHLRVIENRRRRKCVWRHTVAGTTVLSHYNWHVCWIDLAWSIGEFPIVASIAALRGDKRVVP